MIARRALLPVVAALAGTLPTGARADRPDTPGTTELFRYDAGDVVDVYGSPGGEFLLHFTRTGANAVPHVDSDGSGVPDYVERLAALYDSVLAFYRDELGFRAPLSDADVADNGGDERFDVYLLDFGGGADGSFRTDGCGLGGALPGQCVGYMVQENDFAGYGYLSTDYANRVLSSHELFHAVQAAYDAGQGSVISEGTAVWATETFDPSLEDFEGFVGGYLEHTDRPLDRGLSGPVDPFSYGAALFFRFLEERFDRAIVRTLWEVCETEPWLPALDGILIGAYGSSFAEELVDFARWNLYTAGTADPDMAYAEGAMYPPVTAESVSLPHASSSRLRLFYASAQYFRADPGSRETIAAALVGDADGLGLVLAVRRGDAIEIADGPSAGTSGADEVFVVAVNPAMEGDSRRPGLCIGSPDEVDACRAMMEATPDAGAGDAGTGDGGPVPGDAGTDPAPPADGGCDCAIPGRGRAARPTAWPMALALLAFAALRARRRYTRRY